MVGFFDAASEGLTQGAQLGIQNRQVQLQEQALKLREKQLALRQGQAFVNILGMPGPQRGAAFPIFAQIAEIDMKSEQGKAYQKMISALNDQEAKAMSRIVARVFAEDLEQGAAALEVAKVDQSQFLQIVKDAMDEANDPQFRVAGSTLFDVSSGNPIAVAEGGRPPSVDRDIRLPILNKILQQGEDSLNDNEREALNQLQRTDPIDAAISAALKTRRSESGSPDDTGATIEPNQPGSAGNPLKPQTQAELDEILSDASIPSGAVIEANGQSFVKP